MGRFDGPGGAAWPQLSNGLSVPNRETEQQTPAGMIQPASLAPVAILKWHQHRAPAAIPAL